MRDLRADEAAELGILVVDDDFVAQHRKVAGDGERRRTAADAGDALAILRRRLRHLGVDVVVILVVCGDALQPADRHRLLLAFDEGLVLDAAASAGRFAGTVAGPAQDSREDVRLPVDHVGVGVAAVRNQPNVFGNRRVGRTGPLAIDDFVEIVGIGNVGDLQDW